MKRDFIKDISAWIQEHFVKLWMVYFRIRVE